MATGSINIFRAFRDNSEIYFDSEEYPSDFNSLTGVIKLDEYLAGIQTFSNTPVEFNFQISGTFPQSDSNTVALWHFNSSAVDLGPNGHDLSSSPGATNLWDAVFSGNVNSQTFVFNVQGSDTKAFFHSGAIDVTGNMSVEFIFRQDPVSVGSQLLFGNRRISNSISSSWHIIYDTNRKIQFLFASASVSVNHSFTPQIFESLETSYTHIIVTREFANTKDSVTGTLYISGALAQTIKTVIDMTSAASTGGSDDMFYMGGKDPFTLLACQGDISFVKVYDKVLSNDEATQRYSSSFHVWTKI